MFEGFDGLAALLWAPIAGVALTLAAPGYRFASYVNAAASGLTLLAACSLFVAPYQTGPYFHVDDLNVVFLVLNTFVAFTFSAMPRAIRSKR